MRRARGRPLAALLLVLAAGIAGCVHSMVSGGGMRPGVLRDISARVAEARGGPILEPADVRVISRDEVPEVVRSAIAAERPPADLAAYEDSLTTIGIWPPDRSLLDEFVEVNREEVAGLYVPADRTLYVVEDVPISFTARLASFLMRRDLAREISLAHEVVHAAQHREHPALFDTPRYNHQDDAGFAVAAALEGDATRYGLEALDFVDELPPPQRFQGLEAEAFLRTEGALADAPAAIRLTFLFPYAYGYPVSMREGPALLEAPPASTEQVVHAERRREPFLAIDLRPGRAALPEACEVVYENTLGELGISVLLRDLGPEVAPDAWEGWDGDRYLTARCDGRRAFVWTTRWDSQTDAFEFARAYESVAAAVAERAGLPEPPRVTRTGRTVRVVTPPLAPAADRLLDRARTARISTLPELTRHFSLDSDEAGT